MSTTPTPWKPLPTGLPPAQVNTTDGGVFQGTGQIVGLDASDGGYVIIWTDFSLVYNPSGSAVIGQRYDALGNRVGGEVKISQFVSGAQSNSDGSSITNLHNGNIAITYTDLFSGDYDIYVRVANSSLGTVRHDSIDTGGLQTRDASITSFANGSYFVSYTLDNGGGNTDIVARTVSPTGVVGAAFTVRDNGANVADLSQLATLSNNTIVVVYQQFAAGDFYDIYFSIYSSGGLITGNNGVAGGLGIGVDETDADLAALTGGGFVVAFTDAAGDASGQGIRASIYNNAGGLVSGSFQVNTTITSNQNEVSLVALNDGGFVATWEDDFTNLVFGQRFDAMGNKIGVEYTVKIGVGTDSPDSALLADGRIAYAIGDSSSGDADVSNSIWDPRTLDDFNVDGRSDLLLQNVGGQVYQWQMNGAAATSAEVLNLPAAWRVSDTGDFNADGHADALLRHESGQVYLWTMNGTTVTASQQVAILPNDWRLQGVGDFNDDAKADVLLRHESGQIYLWTMNGATVTASQQVANLPQDWHVQSINDFNGDGKADVLLRHEGGQFYIWTMNGATVTLSQAVATLSLDWHVQDTGDFNGDHKADILLRNDSGQIYLWTMNGETVTSSQQVANLPNDWSVQLVDDFNGDGKADVLLRNVSGQIYEWLMNGATVTSSQQIVPFLPNDWQFVGSQHHDFFGI